MSATVTAKDITASAAPEPKAELKQTSTIEGIPPLEDKKEVKEDSISPKFAQLARKEKMLRDKSRALEAEKASLKTQMAEMEQAKGWKSKLSQDPLAVLSEAGISYDQLTNLILNSPNQGDPAVLKLQQEIQALRSAQEQTSNQIKQSEEARYQQAIKQISTDVKLLVDGDETYELIKAEQAQDAVVELIKQTFESEERIMGIEEAANEVESFLLEKALNLAKLKKIQAKMAPVQKDEPKTEPTQKSSLNTLSNSISQSPTKPLTAKDRKERAIAAFMGQKLN